MSVYPESSGSQSLFKDFFEDFLIFFRVLIISDLNTPKISPKQPILSTEKASFCYKKIPFFLAPFVINLTMCLSGNELCPLGSISNKKPPPRK
jgi:hypothetical protein